MRFLSFTTKKQESTYGLHCDGGIIDLGERMGDRYPDLKTLLALDATSPDAMLAS